MAGKSEKFDRSIVVCTQCEGYMRYKGAGVYVCNECGHEAFDTYGIVRRFLEERGPSNILEISEGTGIERTEVSALLKDGRLEVSHFSDVALCCPRCGMPIRTGEYCNKCQHEIDIMNERNKKKGVYNALKNDLLTDSGKMRFVENKKK